MLANLAVVEAQGAAQRVPAVIPVPGLPGHRGHPHPHPLAGEHGPGGGEDAGHQPVLSSHAVKLELPTNILRTFHNI